MDNRDVLFGPHDTHSLEWLRANAVSPEICPGKDPLDVNCKCPDLVYATKVNVATGRTFDSRIYCGCCELPLTHPAAGAAITRPTLVDREAKDEVS